MKLFLLIFFFAVSAVVAEVPVAAPVDWSSVPATTPVARDLNNANLGNCICDLTTNACDPLCCCDTDCTSQEVALFTSCDPNVGSTSSVPYCYNYDAATKIVRINNPEPLDEVVPGVGAVCLVRNNYPSGAGAYFKVPANSAVADPSDGASEWFSDNEPQSNFKVGSKIPVIRAVNVSNTWRLVSYGTGFLTSPTAGRSGYCDAHPRSINFMDPVTTSECYAGSSTAAAASVCASMDVGSTLYQAIRSPAALSSASVIPIVVNIYSATSGLLVETVDPTALLNGILTMSSTATAAASAARHFEVEAATTATFLSGSVCSNAVTRRSLVIAYDASTSVLRVSNATLSIYVADVDVTRPVATTSSVIFIRTGASSLPIAHDGNPGFVTGRPIPAGSLVKNGTKSAIQLRLGGFSIPTGGDCFSNKRKSVKFMHSVMNGGCSLSITESQLQSLCADASGASTLLLSVLRQNITAPPSFPASIYNTTDDLIDQIAATADARPEDTTSWIPVTGGSLSSFPSVAPLPYDPYNRMCNNLFIGLHYKIVVARAGSQANPQDVIVAAFADPIVGTWAIRNDTAYDGSAATTNFLRFKVSFVRYGGSSQETISSVVEPPPLLPKLDDTIFYPFRRS